MSNLPVPTNFDPAVVYAGASNLQLTKDEEARLSAPFEALEYEITPQGFVYLPQAIGIKRLNEVLGVGRWGILMINVGSQPIKDELVKVFFDGALMIRGCFVARACGEAMYSTKNAQQSFASALEAAKTDCRVRCCKDIGIGTDAWMPSFTRKWIAEYAVKVKVKEFDKEKVLWRRKDLPKFPYEMGVVATAPTTQKPAAQKSDLPWLNAGPDFDQALRDLLEGKTYAELQKRFMISRNTSEELIGLLKKEWGAILEKCPDVGGLTELFNKNKALVEEQKWLYEWFVAKKASFPVKNKRAA